MKLTELLEQITPLPWPINEHGSVLCGKYQLRDKICLTGFALAQGSDTKEADANNRYVHHAANVLPALIQRLKLIRDSKTILTAKDLRAIAANAISMAEEVKGHSAQLTPDAKPQTVTMP